MSGRSPSGVASLRARFEQNADSGSLSPRGRSPSGSIASDTSRPLSKVRTSFISVGEPSGQMGDLLGGKEMSRSISGDGANESKAKEPSKLNGNGPTSAPKEVADDPIKKNEDMKAPKASLTISEKPEERTTSSSLAAADPEKATTGKAPNLGTILKGSAFETDEVKKGAAPQKLAPSDGSKITVNAADEAKKGAERSMHETEKSKKGATSQKSAANIAPKTTVSVTDEAKKGATSQKSAASVAPKTTTNITDEVKKGSAFQKSAPSDGPKGAENVADEAKKVTKSAGLDKEMTENGAEGPVNGNDDAKEGVESSVSETGKLKKGDNGSALETDESKKGIASLKPTASAAPKPSVKTASGPKNATAPSTRPMKGPTAIEKAPNGRPKEPQVPESKPQPKTSSQQPATTKAQAVTPAAPLTTKPPAKKNIHPSSPPTSSTGFVKPKPRSPTRPVKLPPHLTAQTAASAAKHGDESHAEPHKDTSAATSRPPNPRIPTHPPPQQRKPPRASMPAAGSSKSMEKEKPKPRMSVAGGSTPGGSFLERMMRPTQSSAQKTHERLELGKTSPPRRPSGSRNVSGAGSKTVTGASTHKPDLHAHNDGMHGDGKEKHGGPTKSEVEHGEGQEAPDSSKGEHPAASSDSSASKLESAPPVEEAKLPSALGIPEENPKDQVAPTPRLDPDMQTF